MKNLIRALLRQAGWTLHRWPTTRFEGMEDTLHLLRQRGFEPGVVVDLGANVGAWTEMAAPIFKARQYHLVEPQPGCAASLARFKAPRFNVHQLALSAAGVSSVRMVGSLNAPAGTGAWVAGSGYAGPDSVEVPACPLDELLAERITRADRVLLKLDLETHELVVLNDGARVLAASEVVVVEFYVFRIERGGMPLLHETIEFMRARDFELYDIAALSARPRDHRLRTGDAVFVRAGSPLTVDDRWS